MEKKCCLYRYPSDHLGLPAIKPPKGYQVQATTDIKLTNLLQDKLNIRMGLGLALGHPNFLCKVVITICCSAMETIPGTFITAPLISGEPFLQHIIDKY